MVNKLLNINIINLDKDIDRKKSIIRQFRKQNIKFKFFNAIYGCDVKKKGLQNFSTNGQIGCFYSHNKVWQKIKKNKWKYTLICEDDIVIPKNFIKKIGKTLKKHKDENWDIITFVKMVKFFPFNKFTGSSCYVINYNCIDKLLDLSKYGHVDLSINFSNLKVEYEDLNINFLDCLSHNSNSLSNSFGWYINMPWFRFPKIDLIMNVKSFVILNIIIFVVLREFKVNVFFSILTFLFFYLMQKNI